MFVWDCIVQEFSAVVQSFEMMLAALGCSIVFPPHLKNKKHSPVDSIWKSFLYLVYGKVK